MTSVKSLSKKPSSLWPVVKTMFPHVHAELFTFPCLLSGYFGGIKLIRNSAPSLWPVHKSKNTTFYFFSFLCVAATFFCLSLSHAFKWNATTATWVCKCINLATPSVSCFQLVLWIYKRDSGYIYRFALCRSGMLVKIWRDEGSTLISQSTVETVQSFSLFLVNKAQIA